jgi:nitrate/nitrite-specific signal transduction histidine kinase
LTIRKELFRMSRTLTQQVTLVTLLVGAVLVLTTVFGLRSVLRSTSASTYLAEHVLAEMEAAHHLEISLVRPSGEAESYARRQEPADRDQAQESVAAAREALATLDTLAAEELAGNDGAASVRDTLAALHQQRLTAIERVESLLRDLTSADAATRARADEAIETFHDTIDQLAADADAREAGVTAGAVQAVGEANHGAMISIGVAFAALALLLGVAVVLLRWRMIRPLRTLEAATEALATNRFAEDIAVTNNDEIGAVQRAFNHMAYTIQAQTRDLEQQVMTAEAARPKPRTRPFGGRWPRSRPSVSRFAT